MLVNRLLIGRIKRCFCCADDLIQSRSFKVLHSGTLAAATMVALLLSTTVVLANDIVITGGRVINPETGLDAIPDVAIEATRSWQSASSRRRAMW
jgi:hypothetical protein